MVNTIHKFLLILVTIFSTTACEKSSTDDNPQAALPIKLINSISKDNETNVDSLFYENDKLVLKKEYLDVGQLDYNTHYSYNSGNQLTKISIIHSSSTTPSFTFEYFYNEDKTLKTIKRTGYNYNLTQHFSYSENQILISFNDNNEINIIANLDTKNRIKEVLRKKYESDEYYKFKEFFYDGNSNIYKIWIKDYENANPIEHNYVFDDTVNPFLALDWALPNNLTIYKMESISENANYAIPTEDYLPYLNTNNVINASGSDYNYDYQYSYDEDNFPVKIKYLDFFNQPSLILDYKE